MRRLRGRIMSKALPIRGLAPFAIDPSMDREADEAQSRQ
jgi:hypothetical protein